MELWLHHLFFHHRLDSEEAESGALERLSGQLLPRLALLAAAPREEIHYSRRQKQPQPLQRRLEFHGRRRVSELPLLEVYLDLSESPLLEAYLDLLRPAYHLDREPEPEAPLLQWAAPWQRWSPPSVDLPSRMAEHCPRRRELLPLESHHRVFYLPVLLPDFRDLGCLAGHHYRQSPRSMGLGLWVTSTRLRTTGSASTRTRSWKCPRSTRRM